MLGGVDGLDAVGRAEVGAQEVDRGLPVDAVVARVGRGRASRVRERREIPEAGDGDERHHEEDALRGDRRREQRERDRRELEPLHVGAEVARHDERDEQRREEDREEPEEAAGAGDPDRDRHPEHAEEQPRHEVGEAEREVPLPGEEPAQRELEGDRGRDHGDGRAPWWPLERAAGEHQHEQQERERARKRASRRAEARRGGGGRAGAR